jgi:hypothetical protein
MATAPRKRACTRARFAARDVRDEVANLHGQRMGRIVCARRQYGQQHLVREKTRGHAMNILLWMLQILGALLYAASGVMKVFLFEKISADVPSFGALPRHAWMALGILELVCVLGLILPGALHWQPWLTPAAAALLATESLVFIGVHMKYRETGSIVMSGVLGLLMAFVAYARFALNPIL